MDHHALAAGIRIGPWLLLLIYRSLLLMVVAAIVVQVAGLIAVTLA